MLRRVVDDTPRPLRELNPDVPDWLERIVQRLMAKDPADRYQTAAEVGGVFERCLAHVQNPTAVPPPSVPRRRRRWPLVAAGVAVLAVVALASGQREPAVDARSAPGDSPPTVAASPQPAHAGRSPETLARPEEIEQAFNRLRVDLVRTEAAFTARPPADPLATELDALRGRVAELERDLSVPPTGGKR